MTTLVAATVIVAACTPGTGEPTTTAPAASTTVAAPSTTAPVTSTTGMAVAEHRIQTRVVDGVGEFYDTVTGERFVPRGMNYNRFLRGADGGVRDAVVSTVHYDSATVDADMAAMSAMGFNVVRIMMETCGVYADGCIAGRDGRLNPDYMDNLVDFLHRAKAHDLFVMVASNTLPDDGYWIHTTASLADAHFDSANNEFLNPRAVPVYVDYWESVVQALVDRGAPLDHVWAYELRQEHHFHIDYPPLSLTSGLVTTANGETYDMAVQDDKDRMVDEGLVYWADLLRDAIRAIDPTAPVTVGFFTPNAPHQVNGPAETRLVRTSYFLRNSSMDFYDLHHYPGNGVDDDDIWENFDIAGFEEKPLVLGEFGGIRPWWTDAARAAAAVMALEVGSCRVGFDGWLVWGWRGDLATDIWWASEGDGAIARVVSPVERPDPCEYGTFDFIRYNHAPTATVTASSADPGWPVENATDETPAYWNATGLAPQWIELALPAPVTLESIRLAVAQDPPGRSVSELWVQSAAGDLARVEVFEGVTATGDVLEYRPAEGIADVVLVRVVTTGLEGGLAPAWVEIELLSVTPPT